VPRPQEFRKLKKLFKIAHFSATQDYNPGVPKKTKNRAKANQTSDMWINPDSTLTSRRGERTWENRAGTPPSNSRLLELADLALGLKKPVLKKKTAAAGTHQTGEKPGPYSL
jgi:hypothetical protein